MVRGQPGHGHAGLMTHINQYLEYHLQEIITKIFDYEENIFVIGYQQFIFHI